MCSVELRAQSVERRVVVRQRRATADMTSAVISSIPRLHCNHAHHTLVSPPTRTPSPAPYASGMASMAFASHHQAP